MGSLFASINVSLRAMMAHQKAIEVIEHNVANANTPGYRRQSAVLAAGVPVSLSSFQNYGAAGQLGTGVTVEKIQRFSTEFFDTRFRTETTQAKRWDLAANQMAQIEVTLAETGSDGLIPKLDAFWKGWQALSADPTNPSLRAEILEQSKILVAGLSSRVEKLQEMQRDQNLLVRESVGEINTLAEKIAHLNGEIVHVQSVGEQPTDLLDERARLLDRLSEITGIGSHQQDNGSVLVSINGHALVFNNAVFKVNVSSDPLTASIQWEDGQPFSASTGELAGLLEVRDQIIPDLIRGLDNTAYSLYTAVNAIHQRPAGFDPTVYPDPPYSDDGLPFFTGVTGVAGAASSIAVNADMEDLNNIMSASADYPGSGEIARRIAGLKETAIAGLGNITINQYYTNQAANLGMKIDYAKQQAKDRGLVASALDEQREALSGVNLDEEAANLVRSQRAFQAATRLVNVMDELLDRVINGMGIAGR